MIVKITVEGGVVQEIEFPPEFPEHITVEVWDFDTDGIDEGELEYNEHNESFIRSIWSSQNYTRR